MACSNNSDNLGEIVGHHNSSITGLGPYHYKMPSLFTEPCQNVLTTTSTVYPVRTITERYPIMDFEKEGKLAETLKYWQDILFLHDWTIKVKVTEDGIEIIEGEEFAGQNKLNMVLKCALILIRPHKGDDDDYIVKMCHEKTLVHELLHCKYNWIYGNGSFEAKYYDTLDHALLEQMAKSLLMVRYGITFDWFKNF